MNKYGYLIYQDYPQNQSGTITTSVVKQTGASDIQFSLSADFENWASFEEGEFDFEKPIYTGTGDIPFTSFNLEGGTITVVPDEPYSGGGFQLQTFYDDYTVTITVNDGDGPREKIFKKSDYPDEFFPFAYDELDTTNGVTFALTIPNNHFLKVVSVSLGGNRLLGEDDFADDPIIETHFSLTNEELAFDTLSFSIRGDKENFNFIAGEKLTHSKTNQEFYVQSATYNSEGTINVEAYDYLSVLDELNFTGFMQKNKQINSSDILNLLLLDDNHQAAEVYTITPPTYNSFSGTIGTDETKRGALRKFLLGNTLVMRRSQNLLRLTPMENEVTALPSFTFNEENICSVPTLEKMDKLTRVHFSKHSYKLKSGDVEEIFSDTVEIGKNVKIDFGAPYNNLSYYRIVNGTEQPITPATGSDFEEVKKRAYFVIIKTNYTQEIVVKGNGYDVSYQSIDFVPNVSSQFKENELMISDCTVSIDRPETIRGSLAFVYGFNKIVSFDSISNVLAGRKVAVQYDDVSLIGYIVRKTDTMNGLYNYEVICK